MNIKPRHLIAQLLCLSLTSLVNLFGQSYQGGVRGLITDPQAAVVQNAQVSLTDETTHLARIAVTDSAGQYVFTAVEPATYTVSIAAPGFENLVKKSVVVGAQQFLTLDFQLKLGSSTESVEVAAGTAQVDVADASNGQLLNPQKLENLPAVNRNPYVFERLDNNVVNASTVAGNSKFSDQTGVANVSIAGGPPNVNNYLVDGVPITNLNNLSVFIPSIEAVQEINLQANTYDAEIGRTGGGTFNTVLKSGTNVLHGVLYGEDGQTAWAARTYFLKPGSPYNINYFNYAGAIGGPVRIPHLYNGKDKTFFWVTEEGYKGNADLTTTTYVPTALERQGDFSHSSVTIYNPFLPLVACPAPYKATQQCRQPFPGNKISAQYLSTVGLNIASSLPLPNETVTTYGASDYFQSLFYSRHADEFIGKVDHQLFPWWYANFSYVHFASTVPSTTALGGLAGKTLSDVLYRKVDAIAQNNTITINPTTVFTAGYGFNRFPNKYVDDLNGFNQQTLGFPTGYVNALQKSSFPNITMQTAASQGVNSPGYAVFYSRSVVAALAKSLGRHSLKFGYDFRTLSEDFTDTSFANGTYSIANTFSEQLPNSGNVSTGADVADLLLGTATSGVVTTVTPLRLNVHYQGLYVQDNYRVSPRLTLNLGLRYEYELGIRERSNQLVVGLDPTVTNPITNTSEVQTYGGVEFAGQNGYPVHCCDASHTMFSPRVGFALALHPTTTLRVGYGVFYAPVYYTANASIAPGYTQTNVYVASNDGNVTPANTLSNPFPNGVQPPSGNSQGYLTGVGNSLTFMAQNRRSPLVEEYSADIQQEFPGRLVFKLGYVGAKGRNLLANSNGTGGGSTVATSGIIPGTANIDQLPDQDLSLGSALLTKVANPYYNKGGSGVIGSSTVAYNQLLRPFPQFSSVNVFAGGAESLYNALNVKLQKDLSHGVSLLASYTWSSSWDSEWGSSNTFSTSPSLPQDAYNLKAEYARSIFDIPNRFAAGATVELPFGHGKTYLAHNNLLDRAVGGWSVNAIVLIQTGEPLAVYQNTNNNSSIGAGLQRPNLLGNPCTTGSPESRINSYFNTSAFSTAPAFTYGNAPRTLNCYGPGYGNLDMSVFKDIHVERVNIQFRAEALNALNTPQFASPVSKFGSATFGQIQSQVNLPRYLQLGGRITF
jgi:trimeric autotransporter adhesin